MFLEGISLRSAKHRLHSATVVTFNVVTFLSLAAGSLYKKLTGDLYAIMIDNFFTRSLWVPDIMAPLTVEVAISFLRWL
jgi:hypothetical protein